MILRKHAFPFIVTLIFTISLTGCSQKEKGFAADKKTPPLSEAALFLAGMELPEDSSLSTYVESKYYKTYKKELHAGWDKFQKPNLEKIKTWWKDYKPTRYNDTVLYPFSGPDIMNALTFFPDADTYILFGLEPPGAIPAPHGMSAQQITSGLSGLKSSLSSILNVNFFRTKGMEQNIGNTSFNGITGLLMFFLAMNGYDVIDVRKIAIDAESNVVQGKPSDDKIQWQNPPRSRVPGVEITFRKSQSKTQKIRYYMLNVIDYALANHSPNFIPYLKKEGRYTTIIKSASYLMHNDKVKFTQIRDAIMDNTDYLVQDDSGIPLRFFDQKKWKLGFHGYYDKPIGLFSHRMQNDLKKMMKEKSTGILPFSYGYDYLKDQSNLMTAELR